MRDNVVACRGGFSRAVIFSPKELDRRIEIVACDSARAPDSHDRCQLNGRLRAEFDIEQAPKHQKGLTDDALLGGRETGSRRRGEQADQQSRTRDTPLCRIAHVGRCIRKAIGKSRKLPHYVPDASNVVTLDIPPHAVFDVGIKRTSAASINRLDSATACS